MQPKPKKILLLYTDKYYFVKQIYPFGLDIIADYLRRHSYDVTIDFPFLPETDPETNLIGILERENPDLIGLGLRNIDTCMACEKYGNHEGAGYRTFYFLPDVKQLIDIIKKQRPGVPLIAGGGAFTISPAAILKMLGIRYGVVGEGEEAMRQFLEAFPDDDKISKIPNMIFQCSDSYKINQRQPYTFRKAGRIIERESKFNYAYETAGLPIQVKRGCNQNCSYCVEPLIEGRIFIFRDHDDVICELKNIAEKYDGIKNIFFTDTEFNIPDLKHCSTLIRKIIKSGLHEHFRFSSQFLPRPFDDRFAELLAQAGFSIVLTCDNFADSVLKMNRTSYRQNDIIQTLELCRQFDLDCTVNLVFGLPGETYETIDHTIEQMIKFSPDLLRRYEYTIGGRIYQNTPLCRFVDKQENSRHLYGRKSEGYLEPYYYCCPESPLKLKAYIDDILPFSIDYKNNYDELIFQDLAIRYLIDQKDWDKAATRFFNTDISTRTSVYDYFFRKLTDYGEIETAKQISERLIEAILETEQDSEYMEQIPLIKYYLSLLTSAN